jgi:hypothetical protein
MQQMRQYLLRQMLHYSLRYLQRLMPFVLLR